MKGIVLIGGKSKRFGKDKVVAKVGGRPLVDHVTEVIQPLFDEVIFIGYKRDNLDSYSIVEDLMPGCGPLGGIYTALKYAKTTHVFVFAADMPNLNGRFISHMISRAENEDHDVVIPIWSKGIEPLHAIYHIRILSVVESMLRTETFRIMDMLNKVDVLPIHEDEIRQFGRPEIIFSNINTVDDILEIAH